MGGWAAEGRRSRAAWRGSAVSFRCPFSLATSPESGLRLSLKGHLWALWYLPADTLAKVPEVPVADVPSQLLAQKGQL